MVENITEKIEKMNEVVEELKTQIAIIYKIHRFYRWGYKNCNIDFCDYVKFVDEGDLIKMFACYNYDEGGDDYSFKKEFFSMSEEELVEHYKEEFKEEIEERRVLQIRKEIEEQTREDEKDRKEFKRLNAKYRGRKREK